MIANLLSSKPVLDPRDFLDRESVLQTIMKYLGKPDHPLSGIIVGEPFIGKTSLLRFLADPKGARYRAERYDAQRYPWAWVFHDRVDPMYISLRGLGERSVSGLWSTLIEALCTQYSLKAPSGKSFSFKDLVRQMKHVLDDDCSRRPVFLLHNVEVLFRELPDVIVVLDNLRSLTEDLFPSNVAVVATSTDNVSTLYRRYELEDKQPSPWGPTAFHSTLGLLELSDAEIHDLVRQTAEAEGLSELCAPGYGDVVIRKAGRHPYLLKTVMRHLLDIGGEIVLSKDELISERLPQNVADELERRLEDDDNVQWFCENLFNRRSQDQRELLTDIARKPIQASLDLAQVELRELERLGLIERCEGQIQVFAETFASYVLRQPPIPQSKEPPKALVSTKQNQIALAPSTTYIPEQGAVLVGDNLRPLTRLEGRLLEYFLGNANQICSTQQLLEHVWGAGRSADVVEKAVNRLRQRLEVDPERPQLLVSVWRQGYQLRMN